AMQISRFTPSVRRIIWDQSLMYLCPVCILGREGVQRTLSGLTNTTFKTGRLGPSVTSLAPSTRLPLVSRFPRVRKGLGPLNNSKPYPCHSVRFPIQGWGLKVASLAPYLLLIVITLSRRLGPLVAS
ncbi:hypothetical protein AVEN_42450-1, partial [Araneus ventricosus]